MSLTPSKLSQIASNIRENEPELLVLSIFDAFEASGYSPFAWKDVKAVAREVLGGDNKEVERHFDRKTAKVDRGMYVRKGSNGAAPAAAPLRRENPARLSKSEGLSWAPAFLAPDSERESWYGEDAGLRRLALQETKCFASYSEGDRACGACPLARFCQEASLARLEELARQLDLEEEARLKEALRLQEQKQDIAQGNLFEAIPAQEVSPAQTPAQEVSPAQTPAQEVSLGDLLAKGLIGQEVLMPFRGVCSYCQGDVNPGVSVIHVKGRGMYHPACAAKL
jgi:hypothetical protein